jgi:hypothetical protein
MVRQPQASGERPVAPAFPVHREVCPMRASHDRGAAPEAGLSNSAVVATGWRQIFYGRLFSRQKKA